MQNKEEFFKIYIIWFANQFLEKMVNVLFNNLYIYKISRNTPNLRILETKMWALYVPFPIHRKTWFNQSFDKLYVFDYKIITKNKILKLKNYK